jgi:hypothetical protein
MNDGRGGIRELDSRRAIGVLGGGLKRIQGRHEDEQHTIPQARPQPQTHNVPVGGLFGPARKALDSLRRESEDAMMF